MDSLTKKLSLIFIATVSVRILFHLLTNFTFDDAFITYRYAENLVAGNGFVYNIGERVLGTTTPLFTFLLSIFGMIGIPTIKSAVLISLVSSGLTAIIIYKFALKLRFTHFAFVPVLMYIFFPRILVTDTAGMETAFFSLLIIAAFYQQFQAKPVYALGLATLACVTRPEGYLLLFMLLVINIYKNKDELANYLLIPSVIIVPWLLFCTYYFGSPVPHSITAKLALYSKFGSLSPLENLSQILALHNPLGWLLLLIAPFGFYWLRKKQNWGGFALLWLILMIIPLGLSKTHLFIWYISPIYPVYLLISGAALASLNFRFGSVVKKYSFLPIIIGVLIIVVSIAANINTVKFYTEYQQTLESIHKNIGLYLRANANENDLVAAEDIGYLGYYSNRKILDRDGLISPESVPYNKNQEYLKLILDYKPDWVVAAPVSFHSQFVADSLFLSNYTFEISFQKEFGASYHIYKKIKPVSDIN